MLLKRKMKKISLLFLIVLLLTAFASCKKADTVSETSQTETETSITGTYTSPVISANQFNDETTKASTQSKDVTTNKTQAVAETTALPVVNNECNVTISVSCKNAIDYGILNTGTFSSVLSPDGVILGTYSLSVTDGDSVMKTLKTALKANNITYSITSGGYIKSISGLSEFDCGETSGWLYKVNGVLPGVSTKNYQLHNGDVVEIIYTCHQGDA